MSETNYERGMPELERDRRIVRECVIRELERLRDEIVVAEKEYDRDAKRFGASCSERGEVLGCYGHTRQMINTRIKELKGES